MKESEFMGVIDFIKCVRCKERLKVMVLKDTIFVFPCGCKKPGHIKRFVNKIKRKV